MAAANSGKLVPRAIIVRPIIIFGTPKNNAVFSAYRVAIHDPTMRAIKPINAKIILMLMFEALKGSPSSRLFVFNKMYIKSISSTIKPTLSLKEIVPSMREKPKRMIDKLKGIKFSSCVFEEVLK